MTGLSEPGWKQRATPEELESCPSCGILRFWLDRAHPSVRPILDRCADPFHESADALDPHREEE